MSGLKVPAYHDRNVVDLCNAWAYEDVDAPPGTRDLLLWMEEGSPLVLRIDPRNRHDVTDDAAMANARAALFAALGACSAIDGKVYRIIGPDGEECGSLGLRLEQADGCSESPESDIEYARRTRRNRNA